MLLTWQRICTGPQYQSKLQKHFIIFCQATSWHHVPSLWLPFCLFPSLHSFKCLMAKSVCVKGEVGKHNMCTGTLPVRIETGILRWVCKSSYVSKTTYQVLSTNWMHEIKVQFIQQYYHSQHIYSIKNSAHTYISINNMNVLHNLNSSLITITENDHYK